MDPDPLKPAWQAQPRPAIDPERLLAERRQQRPQVAVRQAVEEDVGRPPVPAAEGRALAGLEPGVEPRVRRPAVAAARPRDPKQELDAVALLPGLGIWRHAIATSNPEAQKFFDQGFNLLYGFNRYEALRSFRKAAELAPADDLAQQAPGHFHGGCRRHGAEGLGRRARRLALHALVPADDRHHGREARQLLQPDR